MASSGRRMLGLDFVGAQGDARPPTSGLSKVGGRLR